jgi:1,4-alpha-glucan branching enzyme
MTPPIEQPAEATTPLLDPDIERLLNGRLHDPRHVLGVRPVGNDEVVVRVLLPNALRVRMLQPAVELARLAGTPLFEWTGLGSGVTTPVRFSFESADGRWHERYDPYSFPLEIDDDDLARFASGTHIHAHKFLGAHERTIAGVRGVRFAVWAPNAERVSVVGTFNHWDGRFHPMSVRGNSGVWELFLPELRAGELYKYEIFTRETSELKLKTDPYGASFEQRPATASVTTVPSTFQWDDARWLAERSRRDWLREPMSIYEVHLGSWRRNAAGSFLGYRDIAVQLAEYAKDLGFTHVELLPITEHPHDDSWGYQCTGYFAPTSRHGSADDLRALVAELHRQGIGVLLDWVPGHFPKDDHALARFDGTALYEYADWQ